MIPKKEGSGGGALIEKPNDRAPMEEEKERERSIVDRLGTLIRFISGQWNLTVTTGVSDIMRQSSLEHGLDPDDQWYRFTIYEGKTLVEELVHIPTQDLKDITAAKGKAAHEAAHVRIERSREFVPESVYEELGFTATLVAVEERPTDECVRRLFPGAGEWVDYARRVSLEDDTRQNTQSGRGLHPKFLQLTDLIVYEPHLSQRLIRQKYDPDVVSLYETIRDAVERAEETLPHKHASEAEVLEAAKERYRITYAEIWPVIRALAEKDITREAIRTMLKTQGIAERLEKLSEELQRKKKAEDASPEGGEQPDPTDAPEMSPDDCTPEQLKALEERFEELSPEEQKSLFAHAKERLRELEASIVESLQSILSIVIEHGLSGSRAALTCPMESKPPEPARPPREIPAVRLPVKTAYDEAHGQVQKYEEKLFTKLLPLFRPRIAEKTELKHAGSTPDLRAVFQRRSAKAAGSAAVDHRIFQFPGYPTKPDDAHVVLLDLSGSMSNDEKIKFAFGAVALYSEVLSRLRVLFEVLGFQDELIVYKEADELLSESVRHRMSGMLLEPSNNNPGGLNNAAFNDDGPCLLAASKRLDAIRAERKFLHVFSDGSPAGRYSNADDLRNAIAAIRSKGAQALIGYGIGHNTEHVGKFYPVSLPNIPIEHFAEQAGDLLTDLVRHPVNYGIKFRK